MKQNLRGILFRVGVSVSAIAIILYALRDKLDEAFAILRYEVSWNWIIAGVIGYGICQLLMVVRLVQIFRVQKVIISYAETLHLWMVGLFFNLFLPSAVGGDVAKVYYAYKHCGSKIAATTSIILDRLMGFVSVILIALTALAFLGSEMSDRKVLAVIAVFVLILIGMMIFFSNRGFASRFKFLGRFLPSEKWRATLSELYHAIHYYKDHKRVLLSCVSVSVIGQSVMIMIHWMVVSSLGVEMSPSIFFIIVPVVFIVSMAPSIGGLGVREAGLIYLLGKYMPSERALAASLLMDLLIYGFSLGAGFYYAVRGGLKAKEIIEIEHFDDEPTPEKVRG